MATRPMTGTAMSPAATAASMIHEKAPGGLSLRLPGVGRRTLLAWARPSVSPVIEIGKAWWARRATIASLDQMLRLEDHLLCDIGVSRGDVVEAIRDARERSLWRVRRRRGQR